MQVQHINLILLGLQSSFESRVPSLARMEVQAVEGIRWKAAYHSITLQTILWGELKFKVSVALEWQTAIQILCELQGSTVDRFDESGQGVVEELIQNAFQTVMAELLKANRKLEVIHFPMVLDNQVLVAFDPHCSVVRVSLSTPWDPFLVYFSAPAEPKEKVNAS